METDYGELAENAMIKAGWKINPNAASDALREFVRLYLDTYAETQTHPTVAQEAWVIMKAKNIWLDFNFDEAK
jgi:hypothetical protein